MEESDFNKIKKAIIEALNKTHLGGLKGEHLHKHLRTMSTKLHFKWITKNEEKIEDVLKAFDEDIHKHLVTAGENDEYKALQLFVKDRIYLEVTLHSLLLFEKHDLEELEEFTKKFKHHCERKGISEDVQKKVKGILEELAKSWKEDIDYFRKLVNSVWTRSKGGEGWSLGLFEKIHKEGYFVRQKQRKCFGDTLRDEKSLENALESIEQVNSKEDLETLFANMSSKGTEITKHFEIIEKTLMNTWNHLTNQLDLLVKTVAEAVGIHELPQMDTAQMKELHELINNKLNEKYLHELRIEDKQLENIYAELVSEVHKLG